MKLDIITEDKDVLLVEEMFQSGVINEGVLDLVDTATEVVLGAVGFIPGIGEILGDAPLLIKNLMRGDYLGAAIYLVSMEPTPISDTIAKTLRAIQKLAQHTGQEKRLNKLVGWLVRKTGGDHAAQILGLFDKAQEMVGGVDEKMKKADTTDPKVKKSIGVMDKVTTYINQNLGKMKTALEDFLGLIDERAAKIEPTGGVDDYIPDQFVSDLTEEIKETYHRLRKDDLKDGTSKALLYKKKLRSNADNKIEVKRAYEDMFGPIPEIE